MDNRTLMQTKKANCDLPKNLGFSLVEVNSGAYSQLAV